MAPVRVHRRRSGCPIASTGAGGTRWAPGSRHRWPTVCGGRRVRAATGRWGAGPDPAPTAGDARAVAPGSLFPATGVAGNTVVPQGVSQPPLVLYRWQHWLPKSPQQTKSKLGAGQHWAVSSVPQH